MLSVQAPLKEHILRLAQKLPTSPQIFGKLCLLLDDLDADVAKVVDLISIDAGLTARVLRLSNSVFFRGSLSIQTLDEAIERVGFREVHKIVGIAMTEEAFKDGLPAYHLSAKEVFENSVATALAMEVIAQAAGEDPHEAYTVGLLRQIGRLVLGRFLEREHLGVVSPEDGDVAAWERAEFNVSSQEVTALVLESWKLPSAVCLGIRFHHEPETHLKNGPSGAMLHLACWVAAMMGKGLKPEARVWELAPVRLELAGVTEAIVHEAVDKTESAFEALRQQLGLA